jgi:tetratricopeptide (TPR) repeat protein
MQRVRSLAVALAGSVVFVTPVLAQGGRGGEPPRNLQVLPKDMTRPQVTAIMRTFTLALGVRCEHCHAPDPNASAAAGGGGGRGGAPQLDYALDDKETKKIAREMLKMVADINGKYLPAIGRTIGEANRVTCETCHHGLASPQTLRAALAGAVAAKGADSAIALYRELRSRYHGSAAYDFSELSLNEAANQIAMDESRRPAAIALLRLNAEFFPQSVPTYQSLANHSVAVGDTAGAVDALTKALAVQPNNQQLRQMLQRLRPPSGGHLR